MKFLSDLGSCFGGGATVIPAAADTTSSLTTRQQEELGRREISHERVAAVAAASPNLRKRKSTHTSRNWKPALHVISEYDVVNPDMGRRALESDKVLARKVKAKSKPNIPPATHGQDYWKSSILWAVPAFSPTPFSF